MHLKTTLYSAVALALGFHWLSVAPQGGGQPVLPKYQFDKDHVKSWAEEGKKAGQFALQAFSTVERTVRDMLLDVADVIAGTPSAEDFLTGYSNAWANPNTAKSRKTDARAVFDAIATKEGEGEDAKPYVYEKIVGFEKNADGSDKKDAEGNLIPIRKSATAKEWLRDFEGEYSDWLKLARDIRNRQSGRASQGSPSGTQQGGGRGRTKVTPKQFDDIMESMPVTSANQAHAIVVEATKQLAKLPQWETAILAETEMLVNQLKTSKQPIYQNAAAAMMDILNDLRDELRKASDAAEAARKGAADQLAGKSPAQGDIQPPKPAQQHQKAA